MYRTLHPQTAEFTFFSNTHEVFTKIDHFGGLKFLLKFKRIQIIQSQATLELNCQLYREQYVENLQIEACGRQGSRTFALWCLLCYMD